MTKENILKTINQKDETEVQITFMEDNQMRVLAIQDAAFSSYIDCVIPTDRSFVEQLKSLDTVDEVKYYYDI